MDFQLERALRAMTENIKCSSLTFTDDSAIFRIIGTHGDQYYVELSQLADLWPPSCSCADNEFRPEYRCKHIIFLLLRLGASLDRAIDEEWEPNELELTKMLFNAPDALK